MENSIQETILWRTRPNSDFWSITNISDTPKWGIYKYCIDRQNRGVICFNICSSTLRKIVSSMFKVFVSYSTHDLKNVTELQQSLAGTGIEVFVAEHSVAASDHLSEKISSAIQVCDLFILLWSANAKASDWVPQEIGKAHSLNKTILPLVLDEGLALPGFISGLKYLPVFRDPQVAIAQAQDFVLKQFQTKQEFHAKQVAVRQKEQENARNFLVLGGLVLWLFNQK